MPVNSPAVLLRCTASGEAGEGFEVTTRSTDERRIVLAISGDHPGLSFQHEAGGHRWQHIPDHDKHGRVHSSTVTVAVLDESGHGDLVIREQDLFWQTCRSGGAGGQNVNNTDSAILLWHRPSGIRIRADEYRYQGRNRIAALERLKQMLTNQARVAEHQHTNRQRSSQIGSGERADKIRTIRMQDGLVVDHRMNRKMPLRRFLDRSSGSISISTCQI